MSLSINEVINAQIMPKSMGAARRDLSVTALFTPETGQAFTDAETRYVAVASAQDVANLFGQKSEVYKAAQALFSVRPRPNKALVARWAKTEQNIPAVAAALNGGTMSVGIDTVAKINDGAVNLLINGADVALTGLDFSTSATMKAAAKVLNTAITKDHPDLSFVWDETGKRVLLQAKTPGASGAPVIGYATDSGAGTYIGKLLKLENGQATRVEGRDAVTLAAESPAEALGKLENQYQNWYGAYFADAITDEQLIDAHDWIVSAPTPKVLAYTAMRDAQLAWEADNVLKVLHDKNSGRLMVQYNKTGNDHAAAALIGIALSTNWNAINTAKTVKFKQQTTVQSDDRITLNDAEKCRRLGVNFYTDYDGVPMLAEGVTLGGIFIDETVGLDAFLDACQKQAFNTLQGSTTKIPQTDKGQAQLIGALTVVGESFVRNGFLAGGVWKGNEVGELAYGDRLDEGYYFYSDSYDNQQDADRDARQAMPIMCAIKLAGAIHKVDLLIQFNR